MGLEREATKNRARSPPPPFPPPFFRLGQSRFSPFSLPPFFNAFISQQLSPLPPFDPFHRSVHPSVRPSLLSSSVHIFPPLGQLFLLLIFHLFSFLPAGLLLLEAPNIRLHRSPPPLLLKLWPAAVHPTHQNPSKKHSSPPFFFFPFNQPQRQLSCPFPFFLPHSPTEKFFGQRRLRPHFGFNFGLPSKQLKFFGIEKERQMPELAKPDLEQLITELLVALRPTCCRLIQCPDLSADPAIPLKIPGLGQLIYIVPDTISTEEAAKQIERGQILATKNNFHIVSDGRQGQVLHLSLSNCTSKRWRQSIRTALTRLLVDQWEMVFVEKWMMPNGHAKIGLLRASEDGEEKELAREEVDEDGPKEVWMAPVNRRIVAGCVTKKVKKKIIRKVVRKASRGEEEITAPMNGTICNGKMATENGQETKSTMGESTMKPKQQQNGGELAMQNGHGGKTPQASPKPQQKNGRAEGLVGRIANIFNGMGATNGNGIQNGRAGRGRSQSLEEQNGGIPTTEKLLKRADSEGTASTESTTATMTEKTVQQQNGKDGGSQGGKANLEEEKSQSTILQRQDSFSGPFVRIPVQVNGGTPSPEREENGNKNEPLVNGQIASSEEKLPIKMEGNNAKIIANGPTKPLSLSVVSNRPITSSLVECSPPPKEDSPPSPISPPSDDSPNSFHSASGESPLTLATASRRWRREDAPSPSASLIQNVPKRNGPNGGPGTSSISSRLGPPLGSLLSPISSCGSVEAQNDLDDADEHVASEEEESTLMLLNQASAGRSTFGGEDPDELSCSLREDFSMASNSQKAGPTVERIGGGSRGAQIGSTFSTSAAAASAIRQNLLMQQTIGRTSQMMASSSIHTSRRVQSPSPPKQAVSQSPVPSMVRGMVGVFRMPVPILQQIIGLFSYKEMGELRRVHPHWDELCGQLLNAAHSNLLHQAQRLLTDCQRRVHREPRMAQPVQLLTRLHVHVLNPVDGMRAFMDEGVLCFPYGALLDRAYAMLDRIHLIIANSNMDTTNEAREREYDEASIQMDQVGEMARRAALHYRQWVEPEAEKRMSELYRASAQQRLQRLDSFLVESNVSRVERESEKARSELGWEMEQLKQQNQQLRKENRELKQLCQKLDQRVDVLERKFKTMARLLQ